MNAKREWIAYVAPVSIPGGGAAAARIIGNARALVNAGYDVTIISGHLAGSEPADQEILPFIRCVRLNERHSEHKGDLLRRLSYINIGAQTVAWLKQQTNLPRAVIVYSGYTPYIMNLQPWARSKSIPLIFDAVEWYTPQNNLTYLFSPYYWNIEFAMRVLIPRLDGVIAISSALSNYYVARGLPVERIPPLVNTAELRPMAEHDDATPTFHLAYSGSPGHKDLLRNVIEAVDLVNTSKETFILDVAGINDAELPAYLPSRMRGVPPPFLRLAGKVARPEAQAIVERSDFSIFVRDINRVSRCGFPTKFVESLALGTPVITNLTSDLGLHLRDRDTGFVCAGPETRDIATTLKEISEKGKTGLRSMRIAARREAELHFDYQHYSENLERLIQAAYTHMKHR
jgi:glycosyltransferase involved in cell wall biosynthesis